MRLVQRLVRAHIDGAYGDRQALHALHRLTVGLVLLLLVGHAPSAPHEQKLAAKQSDTFRPRAQRRCDIAGLLDVRQQFDRLGIQRHRRRVPQARQALALQRDLALLETILGQDDGRRVDDHRPRVPVDDHPVVLAHQLAGAACANDGRNVHAARHDGRVTGLPAHIGNEAREHALLELQHVGRRQIMCHQHQWHVGGAALQELGLGAGLGLAARAARRRRHGAGHAFHAAQDAFDHLLQIGLALAQVVVLHLVELAADDLQLRGQRPFGVVQAVGDPVLHAADQHLVLQQQQVHIQQRREFGRRVRRQVDTQTLQLIDHGIAAITHARYLGLHLRWFDEVMRHLHATGRGQYRTPDGNTARDGQAVDGEAHVRLARDLFAFAKLVVYQGQQRVHGLLLLRAIGLHLDLRTQACGQHHHAHDALGVDAALALAHPDLAGIAARKLGELGRGTGVQTQLVADGDAVLDHGWHIGFGAAALAPSTRITPWVAPARARLAKASSGSAR